MVRSQGVQIFWISTVQSSCMFTLRACSILWVFSWPASKFVCTLTYALVWEDILVGTTRLHVCLKTLRILFLGYSQSVMLRLRSDCAPAQSDLSLSMAHIQFLENAVSRLIFTIFMYH